MNTYFAPAERATDSKLEAEIKIVSVNPFITGLLHSVNGLLAILDEHRQIVAINDSFLKMLGIDDPADALGLRPGEALKCIHSNDDPAGCGTTKYCSTCGAAIAIVASLGNNIPTERICALTINKAGQDVDIALLVRSHPIQINQKRFLILIMQDITVQQHRAALERTFFHDINNMISALIQASLLLLENEPSDLTESIYHAAYRLFKEVSIQRCLAQNSTYDYEPMWHEFSAEQIINELTIFFKSHPSVKDKKLEFSPNIPSTPIKTDISALLRVICNMVINALEATRIGEAANVWIEENDQHLIFCVRNHQTIPADIARRIFQRNFSTKEQAGRGIGTYSMKLFGEKILGGQVSFTTSKEDGTVFRFAHPL